MREPLRFSGVMPANLLPFTADLAIDEPAYRKHLRWLTDTEGVTGIVANGHAAEVSSLSREERKRTLAIALDEIAGKLPVIVFEYPPSSGIGYSPETLAELGNIPTVAGVKEWSNDIIAYEKNLRAVRASGRPVAVLSAFTMSLMATFLLGADGCISGMGSVAADLQAALLAAVRTGDLEQAR